MRLLVRKFTVDTICTAEAFRKLVAAVEKRCG